MAQENPSEARKTAVFQVSRITFATEEEINDKNWLLGFTKVEKKMPTVQKENETETSQLRRNLEEKINQWNPLSPLGRMVKHNYYKSIKEIRQSNLTITEPSIIDYFLGSTLTTEILYVKPIFGKLNDLRGYVSCSCAGDKNGHFGYSIKFDENQDSAVQGSIDRAINLIDPIKRLPYKIGKKIYYTVPFPVTGSSAGVIVKLAPECSSTEKSTSNVYVNCMLSLAGIDNCVVEIEGNASFVHLVLATYNALSMLADCE